MAECPVSNSLVRLAKDGKDQWYFVSVKGDRTLKLRLIPKPNPTPDLDGVAWDDIKKDFEILESHSSRELAKKFSIPGTDIALKNFGNLISLRRSP